MNVEKTTAILVDWLSERVKAANAKGIIFGLSGGIDSAVVAGLAKRAFPDNVLGIVMPCHSNPEDAEHAQAVAEALDIPVRTVDLTSIYDQMFVTFGVDPKEAPALATANVKPRLRMVTVYFHAALHNYLVAGTGNKDELTIGYFTKYGDGGSDLLPLGNLVKSEVRELAKYLDVPPVVIEKAPSAGLWEGQTDETEMGFGYDLLDAYVKGQPVPDRVRERIEHLNRISQHKREPIPIGPAAITE